MLAIQDEPYSLSGLTVCKDFIAKIAELNMVLGPVISENIDKSKAKKREETASIVGGLTARSMSGPCAEDLYKALACARLRSARPPIK